MVDVRPIIWNLMPLASKAALAETCRALWKEVQRAIAKDMALINWTSVRHGKHSTERARLLVPHLLACLKSCPDITFNVEWLIPHILSAEHWIQVNITRDRAVPYLPWIATLHYDLPAPLLIAGDAGDARTIFYTGTDYGAIFAQGVDTQLRPLLQADAADAKIAANIPSR